MTLCDISVREPFHGLSNRRGIGVNLLGSGHFDYAGTLAGGNTHLGTFEGPYGPNPNGRTITSHHFGISSVTHAPEIYPAFAASGLAPGFSFVRRRAAQWYA